MEGAVRKARYLFGGQTADLAQSQSGAGFLRQGRMAAGEYQPEPVVFYALFLHPSSLIAVGVESFTDLGLRGVKSRPPAHRVNGFEPACRDQPRSGIGGYAILGPAFQCDSEGFVQRFLGRIEVAE